MSLTKQQAYEALARKVRSRVGFATDQLQSLDDQTVELYLGSSEWSYKRLAEVLKESQVSHGGHPDYDYLAEPGAVGETEKGSITTFFLDLRNFSKYCLFLSPQDVYEAKAATIEAVISVSYIYGGYLHEIPGDGVLFFFGGKNRDQVECASQAISAACDAMRLLEEKVIPEYNNDDKYPDIYPKMGLNYGEALWGAYGADGCYEVKATSFYVDIASKMMRQCKAREIAMGDSFKEFLEIDEDYLESGEPYDRQLTVDDETKEIHYKTWILDWYKFWSDKMPDDSSNLSQMGMVGESRQVKTSKTKLRDAPLA